MFDSDAEAVRKISAVLADPGEQERLRAAARGTGRAVLHRIASCARCATSSPPSRAERAHSSRPAIARAARRRQRGRRVDGARPGRPAPGRHADPGRLVAGGRPTRSMARRSRSHAVARHVVPPPMAMARAGARASAPIGCAWPTLLRHARTLSARYDLLITARRLRRVRAARDSVRAFSRGAHARPRPFPGRGRRVLSLLRLVAGVAVVARRAQPDPGQFAMDRGSAGRRWRNTRALSAGGRHRPRTSRGRRGPTPFSASAGSTHPSASKS